MAESKEQMIVLKTTPADQIPAHIAVNARCRDCDKLYTWAKPPDDWEVPHCQCEEPNQLPVFHGDYSDKTVAICGAGPTLYDAYREIRKADEVWAANRAAYYLEDKNMKCTHGIAIDAGTSMFENCWKDPPKVKDYLLASTVHPKLIDLLLEHDKRIQIFHSARGGFQNEFEYYEMFFPPTNGVVGQGLNCVNRAVELAVKLNYKRIYVCGADNAFKDDAFYADGTQKLDHDDGAVYLEGEVFGRKWKTTPDMLMSATNLARMMWAWGSKVEIIGNTLPRALSRTSEEFLDRCVRWATDDEKDKIEEAKRTVAERETVQVD